MKASIFFKWPIFADVMLKYERPVPQSIKYMGIFVNILLKILHKTYKHIQLIS